MLIIVVLNNFQPNTMVFYFAPTSITVKCFWNLPPHMFIRDGMHIESDLAPKGKILLKKSRYEELREYYLKDSKQLAEEYISDPTSLTKDELERLVHEASKKEERIIQSKFSIKDPILNGIIERDFHNISNGSKLFL